jgi:hypothetical protein
MTMQIAKMPGPILCLTAAMLPGCGGISETRANDSGLSEMAESGNGEARPTDGASETASIWLDATLDDSPDDSAEAIDRCENRCPASEPAFGDPCAFSLWCEYGKSPFVACNTVYDCVSGHVVLDRTFISDASICDTGLQPGCPASRTAIVPGSACVAPNPVQCIYAEGECDCIQGRASENTWLCSAVDAGASRTCPVPRPMLGTPCNPASASELCQYIAPCTYEACSTCGNQWSVLSVPCGELPPGQ